MAEPTDPGGGGHSRQQGDFHHSSGGGMSPMDASPRLPPLQKGPDNSFGPHNRNQTQSNEQNTMRSFSSPYQNAPGVQSSPAPSLARLPYDPYENSYDARAKNFDRDHAGNLIDPNTRAIRAFGDGFYQQNPNAPFLAARNGHDAGHHQHPSPRPMLPPSSAAHPRPRPTARPVSRASRASTASLPPLQAAESDPDLPSPRTLIGQSSAQNTKGKKKASAAPASDAKRQSSSTGTKPAPPGGRASGARNYSNEEFEYLLEVYRELLPLGQDGYRRAGEVYAEWAVKNGYSPRTWETLKNRFQVLCQTAREKPTGDAERRKILETALEVEELIQERSGTVSLQDLDREEGVYRRVVEISDSSDVEPPATTSTRVKPEPGVAAKKEKPDTTTKAVVKSYKESAVASSTRRTPSTTTASDAMVNLASNFTPAAAQQRAESQSSSFMHAMQVNSLQNEIRECRHRIDVLTDKCGDERARADRAVAQLEMMKAMRSRSHRRSKYEESSSEDMSPSSSPKSSYRHSGKTLSRRRSRHRSHPYARPTPSSSRHQNRYSRSPSVHPSPEPDTALAVLANAAANLSPSKPLIITPRRNRDGETVYEVSPSRRA